MASKTNKRLLDDFNAFARCYRSFLISINSASGNCFRRTAKSSALQHQTEEINQSSSITEAGGVMSSQGSRLTQIQVGVKFS